MSDARGALTMRAGNWVWLGSMLLLWLASVGCGPCDGTRSASPVVPVAARVYRDPVTRRFGPPPAGVTPAPGPAGRLANSSAGLLEVDGPRGGRMVRLEGRFQNQLRATSADGRIFTTCGDTPEAR